MPCLVKERTATSPGIITVTHAEALSPLLRVRRVRDFLDDAVQQGRWLFGVHVQGDCSWMERWPLKDWQSFILWPDKKAPWLANVPEERRIALNCVNLMPVQPARPSDLARDVDLCVISRASTVKRIRETLLTLRALMDMRPGLTAVIIVPDNRHQSLGERTYGLQRIDRSFFELPLKLFKARELKQLSFISSSNDSFGRFPVSDLLMTAFLERAKFMFLPSHSEGTPRVIAESFMAGTPVILSEKLQSGMRGDLSVDDTLFVNDDPVIAAAQIAEALKSYDRFRVNIGKFRRLYGRDENLPLFRVALEKRITACGLPLDGRWFLEDLHLRLACHGQIENFGFFNNASLFFDWMSKVDVPGGMTVDPYDEAVFYGGSIEARDQPNIAQYFSNYFRRQAHPKLIRALKSLMGG